MLCTFKAYAETPSRVIDLGENQINSKIRRSQVMVIRNSDDPENLITHIFYEKFSEMEARFLQTDSQPEEKSK